MKNTTLFVLLGALSCGGGQKPGDERLGSDADPTGAGSTSDLDVEPRDAGTTSPKPETLETAPPAAAVTFVMNNTYSEELVFNMDRGWGANILAFRGKPPKAVSIIPFAKYCTAACDAPADERCPFCPEPETLKDKKESQHFEHVASGGHLEVPWDGKVHVYSKTQGVREGKKRRCECYRVEDAQPGTYQVKACGLRLTKTANQRSQLQCVEASLTVPASAPERVEFQFDAPKTPGKRK
jgi:hypothetical protein